MDRFVEILASQNPTMDLQCQNPDCSKETKIKTADFFSTTNGTYTFVCSYCGSTTNYHNVKQELDKLKKQFKDMGFSW